MLREKRVLACGHMTPFMPISAIDLSSDKSKASCYWISSRCGEK